MSYQLDAYENAERQSLDGRQLEAAVILKAARRLQVCLDEWEQVGAGSAYEQMADALRYNQKLWTVFQAELASDDCPLPIPIRANLLRLTGYIDRTTSKLLIEPVRSQLESLININNQIAQGLGGGTGGERRAEGSGEEIADTVDFSA